MAGVIRGLDRRLLPRFRPEPPGVYACPIHGVLVTTALPSAVYCRCGKRGVLVSEVENRPSNTTVTLQ
jgi:hypothetical protein